MLFFFLSTKMLPIVAGILPLYLIAQKAHLLDNIWYLILLYTAMNLPIAIWMLRSFLAEVPVGDARGRPGRRREPRPAPCVTSSRRSSCPASRQRR